MTQQSKIEAARVKAATALANELLAIERDETLRNIAPEYAAVSRTGYTKHSNAHTIRYEAKSARDVVHIIESWRNKYGAFLPIGKYKKACAVVTAFPWGEYAEQSALELIENDAVRARNHKGKGFSSVEFVFYLRIDERQIEVSIDMAFRTYIQGFEGYINAHYDRHGNVDTVQKRKPAAFNDAAYSVSFGGGGLDSADWYGVFNCDAILSELKGAN